jgi:hypothetical protein
MDLTGEWTGSYVYVGELHPVPFHASIRDHDGRLSGIIHEPAEEWADVEEAHAVLTGERRGSAVNFTKIYDAIEFYPDPVRYEGTVDADGCEIAGEWHITGEWSGTFIMTRPGREQEDVEAEETAQA